MIPHPESVSPELLDLLHILAKLDELRGAALGGGTSLALFCRKYGQAGRFLAIRSLNWFDDTIGEPDPLYLNGWTWPEVRHRMAKLAQTLVID